MHREFDLENVGPESRAHLKDHLFDDLLQMERHVAMERNALLEELRDFAGSIRERREPQVTGQQGRNVLAVAEQILDCIQRHRWDGESGNRKGPLAIPTPSILRGPHWSTSAAIQPRREAG
jgi:hypothetical protein